MTRTESVCGTTLQDRLAVEGVLTCNNSCSCVCPMKSWKEKCVLALHKNV